jgi:hypothetical protein
MKVLKLLLYVVFMCLPNPTNLECKIVKLIIILLDPLHVSLKISFNYQCHLNHIYIYIYKHNIIFSFSHMCLFTSFLYNLPLNFLKVKKSKKNS